MIPPGWFYSTREWFYMAGYGQPVLGLVLLGVGVLCLLLGWRVYRVLVLVNAAVLCGMAAAAVVGESLLGQACWAVGTAVGGVLAWRFPKNAAVALGGLLGAYVTAHFLQEAGISDTIMVFSLLVVFVMVIGFGRVYLRHTLVVLSAFQGALLVIWGVINILYESRSLTWLLRDMVASHSIFVPFTIAAVMMFGVFLQLADSSRHRVGMSG